MPSILPGYEYDIFISYRQKDNKGERWVTEFIQALKAEIESTFKEDISIYFDDNEHDGLLETHDVDAPLKCQANAHIVVCAPQYIPGSKPSVTSIAPFNMDLIGIGDTIVIRHSISFDVPMNTKFL